MEWHFSSFKVVKRLGKFFCNAYYFTALLFTASFAYANDAPSLDYLSKHERIEVNALIQKYQSDMAILPISQYEPANQALYLGSWLATQGYSYLGQKVLKDALRYSSIYSSTQLGSIYNLLASSAEAANAAEAEVWYIKAIDLGNLTACVNFGVYYERKKAYKDAANTYKKCTLPVEQVDVTEKETVALAYLNLGTLHYNGLLAEDEKKGKKQGGELWQASLALNPFDIDIHYNLGVYHSNISLSYKQARYHFSVCAWLLAECSAALANPKLISLSSEAQHLYELLDAKDVKRRFLLADRAVFWLGEPTYFDSNTPFGEISLMIDKDETVTGIEVTFSRDYAGQAISILNQLVFVDMFSKANVLAHSWSKSLKPRQTEYLGQSITLSKVSSKWNYKIQFRKQINAKNG